MRLSAVITGFGMASCVDPTYDGHVINLPQLIRFT